MTDFSLEPIKPHIGAVAHVARERLLDPEFVDACRVAIEERGVLVFPQIHLTDAEQLAFTDLLGTRGTFTKNIPGADAAEDPDVYKITLDKKINWQPEYVLGTYFWHIDGVTLDQPLPKATLLTARKLSAVGGQTEFANTYAAYEQLPEAEKAALEGVMALHTIEASMRPVFGQQSEEQLSRWRSMGSRMAHPLVWTHASGRKSLVIGTHADSVLGRSLPEGRSLLIRLQEWAAQPDFSYRHEWQEGDFVVWDNSGTMHRVVPYPEDSGRTMHRTTIHGEERISGSYALTD